MARWTVSRQREHVSDWNHGALSPGTGARFPAESLRILKRNRCAFSAGICKGQRSYLYKWEKSPDDGKTYLMIGPSEQSFSRFQRTEHK